MLTTLILPLLCPPFFQDPAITQWRRNLDGTTGTSSSATVNQVVGSIEADVTGEFYGNRYVFVDAAGVPSHEVGPWNPNPNMIAGQNWTWRIPLNPTAASVSQRTWTPMGQIAVASNGVPFYNAKDGFSYLNRGVWFQNANVFESVSFDVGIGHPQRQGVYHYHQAPRLLLNQRGNNAQYHSLIMGYAFDGYPIYGPYGFANTDGTGGIHRMESGYQMRNITTRRTLPDGTSLSPYYWGPDISINYPLGCYLEDYEFVAASGDLDECNGRFAVTPEYPQGTYTYFLTQNSNGDAVYPYVIGPQYYGVVDTANLGPNGGHSNIPSGATEYSGFAIYANDVVAGGTAQISLAGAYPGAKIYLGYSAFGPGPSSTPWGDIALDAQHSALGPFHADAQGKLTIQAAIPGSISGTTLYSQAIAFSAIGVQISEPGRVTVE